MSELLRICEDLVALGAVSEKEARELVGDWAKRATEQQETIQRQIDEAVQRALGKLGVSRVTDVKKLEARIADLERQAGREKNAAETGWQR